MKEINLYRLIFAFLFIPFIEPVRANSCYFQYIKPFDMGQCLTNKHADPSADNFSDIVSACKNEIERNKRVSDCLDEEKQKSGYLWGSAWHYCDEKITKEMKTEEGMTVEEIQARKIAMETGDNSMLRFIQDRKKRFSALDKTYDELAKTLPPVGGENNSTPKEKLLRATNEFDRSSMIEMFVYKVIKSIGPNGIVFFMTSAVMSHPSEVKKKFGLFVKMFGLMFFVEILYGSIFGQHINTTILLTLSVIASYSLIRIDRKAG